MSEIQIESNGKCSKCGKKISKSQTVCSKCIIKEILGK